MVSDLDVLDFVKRKGTKGATDKEIAKNFRLGERSAEKHLKNLKDDKKIFADYRDNRPFYLLLKYSKNTIKKNQSNRKIIVDPCRCGITNYGLNPSNLINSKVEILLRISNPTKENIGLSKILVVSENKNYPIAVNIKDHETGKSVSSLILKPQETRLLELFEDGLPIISIDGKSVSAIVEIYDTKNKAIKTIPIKLFIGYRASL